MVINCGVSLVDTVDSEIPVVFMNRNFGNICAVMFSQHRSAVTLPRLFSFPKILL